jgi:hypothetical protein
MRAHLARSAGWFGIQFCACWNPMTNSARAVLGASPFVVGGITTLSTVVVTRAKLQPPLELTFFQFS